MKKVAIIGASGYSGEELVRLLLNHPHVDLVAVTSRQSAGQTVAQVFPKFASHPKSKALRFTDPNAEVLAKQGKTLNQIPTREQFERWEKDEPRETLPRYRKEKITDNGSRSRAQIAAQLREL